MFAMQLFDLAHVDNDAIFVLSVFSSNLPSATYFRLLMKYAFMDFGHFQVTTGIGPWGLCLSVSFFFSSQLLSIVMVQSSGCY